MKLLLVRLWGILTRREFWFILIIYPGMFFVAKYLLSVIRKPASENAVYFGFVTFLMFSFVIFTSVLEIFTRKFKHELQGEKLKIREREGVKLQDQNNVNKN